MALTITEPSQLSSIPGDDIWGRLRVAVREITFDASYDAGGEAFSPNDVGLQEFLAVIVDDAATGYSVQYDHANEKLLVFGVEQDADAAVTDPFDEEDDTVDLSTVTVRVVAIGI